MESTRPHTSIRQILRSLPLFLLMLLPVKIFAQLDTLVVYDTIFEYREPLIIELPKTRSVSLYDGGMKSILLGLTYGARSKIGIDRQYTGLMIEKEKKVCGLTFSFGINYINSTERRKHPNTYRIKEEIHYDTLTSYIHIVDGVPYEVHITDKIVNLSYDSLSIIGGRNITTRQHLLGLSFNGGYELRIKSTRLYLFLHVNPAMRISARPKEHVSNSTFHLFAGAGMQYLVPLSPSMQLAFRYTNIYHIPSRFSQPADLYHFAHAGTIGLKYFFDR